MTGPVPALSGRTDGLPPSCLNMGPSYLLGLSLGLRGRPQRSSRIPFSLIVTMTGLSPAVRTGFPVGGVQEDLEDFSHSFNEPPAC